MMLKEAASESSKLTSKRARRGDKIVRPKPPTFIVLRVRERGRGDAVVGGWGEENQE
jgi:hypothetical protein